MSYNKKQWRSDNIIKLFALIRIDQRPNISPNTEVVCSVHIVDGEPIAHMYVISR